jgi:hypothetical protein
MSYITTIGHYLLIPAKRFIAYETENSSAAAVLIAHRGPFLISWDFDGSNINGNRQSGR